MSYAMCSRITFPANDKRDQLLIERVNSVHIESSWKILTDTAEIILPKKVKEFSGNRINQLFQAGDEVQIELGYDGNLYVEFIGYIASVSTGVPVVLHLEDEMYKLKRKTVKYSSPNAKLEELLKDIAPDYQIDAYAGVELGAVRYSNVTAAQVLEDIQKKTGLYSYFKNKTLRCGKVYGDDAKAEPVKVNLERNAVSEELNSDSGKAKEIQVKVISINKGGKKLEATAGKEGGTVNTLTYVGITVEADLKKQAERDLKRLMQTKLSGGITLFGIPRVCHGMILELTSELTPEMDGSYYVEKVTKDFSDDATYRQKIELGGKAK